MNASAVFEWLARTAHAPLTLSQQAVYTTLQPGTMTNALQIEVEKNGVPITSNWGENEYVSNEI